MRGDHDGRFSLCLHDQLHRFLTALRIQRGKGLIEQKQLCFTAEHEDELKQGTHPAAHGAQDHLIAESEAIQPSAAGGRIEVIIKCLIQKTDLPDPHEVGKAAFIGQISDPPAVCAAQQLPVDTHAAHIRQLQIGHGPQQRRLAGAVASAQCIDLARLDHTVHMEQRHFSAIAFGYVDAFNLFHASSAPFSPVPPASHRPRRKRAFP